MHWIHALVDWTVGWAESPYALWALFGIAFAESSFFPIPPDVLQIALSVIHPAQAFLYASVALVGSILGAVLGFGIGRYGGRPILDRFFSSSKIHYVEKLFQKYDMWAIGIAGFTPVPYKIFAISGGAFKLNFKRFILVSIISRGARFYLVASCFYLFGEQIKDVVMKNVNLVSILFVVLLVGGYLIIHWMSLRSKRKQVA